MWDYRGAKIVYVIEIRMIFIWTKLSVSMLTVTPRENTKDTTQKQTNKQTNKTTKELK